MMDSLGRMADMARTIGMDIGSYHLSLLGFFSAIFVLILIFLIVRVSLGAIKWLLRRNPRIDGTQRLLIEKLTGILLFGIGVLVAVDVLGIDLTALTVFSGALGLAVGFGLQKTVGNLIAGIIILMDRSIKPGDIIVVGDLGGNNAGHAMPDVGRVTEIGIRAASVVTRDGKKHLIPNEVLMTQPVENWSYSSREVRVRMRIPVGYDADLRLAQRLIIDAARANPRVLGNPEPMVWITAFGDNAVDHELRFWIDDPESGLGNIQGEVFLGIWDAFRGAGITLPAPRLNVAVRETL
ncbi:MAG: mechanosensitive ion channel domain-containing protein [Pseudomonadota bacterium]|mgnify:CR=1 FL=1